MAIRWQKGNTKLTQSFGASIRSDDKEKCRQNLLEVSDESFEEKVSKALHVIEMRVQKSLQSKNNCTVSGSRQNFSYDS